MPCYCSSRPVRVLAKSERKQDALREMAKERRQERLVSSSLTSHTAGPLRFSSLPSLWEVAEELASGERAEIGRVKEGAGEKNRARESATARERLKFNGHNESTFYP
jgi:hypothetical protein